MEFVATLFEIALTVFDGSNYQLWEMCTKAYLEALDLWKTVGKDYYIHVLQNNPTMTQIKVQKDKKTK